MTTLERITAVADAFAGRENLGFGGAEDLRNFIVSELGHLEILDRTVNISGAKLRARAPESIYHICAGNLSVSAETSLVLGLLLGSRLWFKLPSGGLPDFVNTVEKLPLPLREKVTLLAQHDAPLMLGADAVVVFGDDETVSAVHRQVHWRQRFLGYGNKISLGLVDADDETPEVAAAAAQEILAYEQLGCLSPQAYLCRDPRRAEKFSALLANALAAERQRQPLPALSFDDATLRRHFCESAAADGERVLAGTDNEYVIISGAKTLRIGAGHGTVSVLGAWELADAQRWQNKISAVSHSRPLPLTVTDYFAKLGVSRFCHTGDLQNPPLAWRHDQRPRLADLVRWVTFG